VNSDIAAGLGQQMAADEMKAIVDTAHLLGRKVAVHAHGADGIKAALNAGADSIEHGSYTDDEANALFKQKRAYLVMTMLAPRAALAQARAGSRNPNTLAKAEEVNQVATRNWSRAVRAGVPIAFGTDNGVGAHGTGGQEFALMVEAGMTPAAAIRAATVNAAELLGRSDRLGTLEPGKDADIIAVSASPLQNVRQLENVRFVMRRGVVHKLDGRRQAFPPEN
jgi:imidazolonepropionase-like amidohydrolase